MNPEVTIVYRELSLDASQVSLGDDSTLTLTLTINPTPGSKSLADWLRESNYLALSFDHLADSRPADEYQFGYEMTATGLVFHASELLQQPRGAGGRAKVKPLFREVELMSPTVVLSSKTSITIAWDIRTWGIPGTFTVGGEFGRRAEAESDTGAYVTNFSDFGPAKLRVQEQDVHAPVRVSLSEAKREETPDQMLWSLIRRRTVNFSQYRSFIDSVLCVGPNAQNRSARAYVTTQHLPFSRSASYGLLRAATEFFLMQEAGLVPSPDDSSGTESRHGNLNAQRPNHQLSTEEQRRLGGPGFSLNALRDDYLEQLAGEGGKALPYFKIIADKLSELTLKDALDIDLGGGDLCYGILKSKLQAPPLLELIWSYWHEEGGLVQTMNALSLRFQNVRRPGPGPDPLANLAIDPLRPLNNIIWGYIEDERNRLTMNRRNLEYQYEYGIGLIGRGVQPIAVAENRAFFLRGFHSLLRACTEFYQQANFTTVIPDGFPILNHLREVHLTLAEGAHNQYGDLPWTARAEMLTQQWILARPEVREFLGGRVMVPYTEPWMDRVDNMKTLQGWTPTNITHFHDLGAFGEQLLLSIRYGSWNGPSVGAANAANWAHYWREEIQRYIHAYKAVTGVDLATDLGDIRQNAPDNEERYLQPAQLIERQNAVQQGQLRRTRQLNGGMGPLRQPAFGAAPRRRALNE
ncbi:8-amino-7-oxononanoate synthase [Hymenobacter setariae]|uniref:8-amino-7-oxononanoate synthase n=1 Tax=Hymenobacter setariae TaxID=2594794 RepID=A0A558BPV3_9BACT|nr:8-amino-7-oxononanoate synthase [Hymenobacter setariae]TVT38550.1 8-amino-7-oxononanoate synthase [Hymenobacter setariae]